MANQGEIAANGELVTVNPNHHLSPTPSFHASRDFALAKAEGETWNPAWAATIKRSSKSPAIWRAFGMTVEDGVKINSQFRK
jgi:hypothetical protein